MLMTSSTRWRPMHQPKVNICFITCWLVALCTLTFDSSSCHLPSAVQCALDPIPLLLLLMVDVLLLYLTAMRWSTLHSVRDDYHYISMPSSLPCSRRPDWMHNIWRTTGHSPVWHKLVERMVSSRLASHVNAHGLMPQLRFQAHHRPEKSGNFVGGLGK